MIAQAGFWTSSSLRRDGYVLGEAKGRGWANEGRRRSNVAGYRGNDGGGVSSGLGMWKVATRLGGRLASEPRSSGRLLGDHRPHGKRRPGASRCTRGAGPCRRQTRHVRAGQCVYAYASRRRYRWRFARESERERRGAAGAHSTQHTRLSRRCPPAGRTATAPTTRALATEVCGGEIGGGGAVRPPVYKK